MSNWRDLAVHGPIAAAGFKMPEGFTRLEEYTYIFGSRFVFNVPIIAEPEKKTITRERALHPTFGDNRYGLSLEVVEEDRLISQIDASRAMNAWLVANAFANLRRIFETERIGNSGVRYEAYYGWGYKDLKKIFQYVKHVLHHVCMHNLNVLAHDKKDWLAIKFDDLVFTEKMMIFRHVFKKIAEETENVEERAYFMDYLKAYGLIENVEGMEL